MTTAAGTTSKLRSAACPILATIGTTTPQRGRGGSVAPTPAGLADGRWSAYGFIARFQGMNGNGKTAPTLAGELFGILRQHEKTRKGISEAVAARFCQSNSFGSARENMKLLETLAHWDSSLSERVLSASTANRQIADAVWQWNPAVPLRNRLSQFLAGRENS